MSLVGEEGWTVEAIWPRGTSGGCQENGRSLVLRLGFGGRHVLLTGDIGRDAEHALLASGIDLRADVIKVPHHGSATSSTAAFLRAVEPVLAIASAGLANRYGFPKPEVRERYESLGTRFLSTERNGAVRVSISRSGAMGCRATRRPPRHGWSSNVTWSCDLVR